MSRLLCHRFSRPDRGLSGSSSSRVFIEFPHCFFGLSRQLGLAFGPFFRKILTTLDAGGVSFLARCQWSSWAWRIKCEFLHILWSDISVLPPFSCPSPFNPLYAHLALSLVLLSELSLIRCAIVSIDVLRYFKRSHDLRSLSSFLWLLTVCHILQFRNLNNRIL